MAQFCEARSRQLLEKGHSLAAREFRHHQALHAARMAAE
jgi:hypothetical protein